MTDKLTPEERQKALASVCESTGKTPREIERELEENIYAELVSTIRLIKQLGEENPDDGALLLGILRRHERNEKEKDSPEGHMASVILDAYFFERGNFRKMEERITDAARSNGIDVAACAAQIEQLMANKRAHALQAIARRKGRPS